MTDVAAAPITLDPWVPEDTFGSRLALIRQHFHWNVSEAATACGIAPATWTKWEEGAMPRDFIGTCEKIADKVHCSMNWLVGARQNWKELTGSDLHSVPTGAVSGTRTRRGENPNQLELTERPKLTLVPALT